MLQYVIKSYTMKNFSRHTGGAIAPDAPGYTEQYMNEKPGAAGYNFTFRLNIFNGRIAL